MLNKTSLKLKAAEYPGEKIHTKYTKSKYILVYLKPH